MILKPKPLDIKKESPYASDYFSDRELFAKEILNIITNSDDDSLVIAIDDNWGNGKTAFLNMWQTQLENDDHPCVYIDAFMSDFSNDAFMTIASPINHYVASNSKDTEFKEKVIKVASKIGALALSGLNKITKHITSGAVSPEEVLQSISSFSNTDLETMYEKELETYQQKLEDLSEFKQILSEISSQFDGKKLIIMIDELDRCRPIFAIELLEKMKHLFSVPNVVFVLAINQKELCKSIQAVYGSIDANQYLQKFIDIYTALPNKKRIGINIDKYINELCISHKVSNDDIIKKTLQTLAKYNTYSLRDIEKMMLNIVLIQMQYKNAYPVIVCTLATVKVKDPILIARIKTSEATYDEFCDALNLPRLNDKNISMGDEDWKAIFISSWVAIAFKEEDSVIDEFKQKLKSIKEGYNYFQDDIDTLLIDCIYAMELTEFRN